MKKYIFGLALLAGGLFTSCDKDNIGTIYETNAQNISFETDEASLTTKTSSASVTIMLTRSNTVGEYTAHYTLNTSDSGIFSDANSGTATFAAGEWSTSITINAGNMKGGTLYTCQLQLSSEDAATADEVIGTSTNTTVNVSVMCDYNWVALGTGFYSSPDWWEEEYNVEIEHAEGTGLYKIKDLFAKGYDVQFEIGSDNVVRVPEQVSWVHSSYGKVYLMGYLNEDDSCIAGSYNPETKQIPLTLIHYVSAGTFGVFTDTLTMP